MSHIFLSNLAIQGRNTEFKEVVKERNYEFNSDASFSVFGAALSRGNLEIIEFIYNHDSFVKNKQWYDRTFQYFLDALYNKRDDYFDFKNNFEIIDYLLKNIDIEYNLNDCVVLVMLWDNHKIETIQFLLKYDLFKNVVNKSWLIMHYYQYSDFEQKFHKLVQTINF